MLDDSRNGMIASSDHSPEAPFATPVPQGSSVMDSDPRRNTLNEITAGFPALSAFARELIDAVPGDVYRKITAAVDGVVIDAALRTTKGNQLHAARLLGISRTTLRAKLRSLGLAVEKQLAVEEPNDRSKPNPL